MNEILRLLPFEVGPNMPIALAAVAAFVSVIAVWQALRLRDPVVRRARSIVAREAELRGVMLSAPRRSDPRDRGANQSQAFMAQVVARLKLKQGNKVQAVRTKLARAGVRSHEAVVTFLFFKLSLPLVAGGAAVLVFQVLKIYDLTPVEQVIASLAAVIFGAYAPDIWIKNRVTKRKVGLTRGLPDALDLLVICVEAGLSLDAALKRTSGELNRSSPELSDELTLTSVELGFLPERAVALRNLAERTGLKPIGAVVSALLQTEKFGTPLAQSLRVLAAEFRNQRLLKAEEKAARLPATLTVPMVLFILPTLFMVLIGPAIIKAIDSFRGMG